MKSKLITFSGQWVSGDVLPDPVRRATPLLVRFPSFPSRVLSGCCDKNGSWFLIQKQGAVIELIKVTGPIQWKRVKMSLDYRVLLSTKLDE